MRQKLFVIASFFCISIVFFPDARSQGVWSTDSSSGFTARSSPGGCVISGKVFVIGGDANPFFQGYTDTVEVFDPITHGWSIAPSMPTARSGLSCSFIGSKIFAMGGENDAGPMAIVEVFDTATKMWTSSPPMPRPRTGHCANVISGKIYLTGGTRTSVNYSDTVDIYDPLKNSWSSGTPLRIVPDESTASVVDGKLYIIGGYYKKNDLEIYNPVANSWTAGPSVPSGSFAFTSGVMNGKIYVIGGADNSRSLQIFDPSTNIWSTGPDMPTGRVDFASFVVGNRIYALGGIVQSCCAVNTNEVFSPDVNDVRVGYLTSPKISLVSSYPNPFSQSTTIHFTSEERGFAQVTVVNLLGNEVARLFDGELEAGEHSFEWDALGAAAGTYFCIIRQGSAGAGGRHAMLIRE